jgi:hypothetical protein
MTNPPVIAGSLSRGPGLFRVGVGDGLPLVTNIRRIAGRDTPPGERLIAAATILLAVLAAGFLYVTLNAQYHYIFAVKSQSVPSMVEASGLDAGMIVFSLLALGLARAGQAARTERALILACALASAGMQYEAADTTSPRSLAVYVMPPVFLAVVVDRVIAVVRRWVTGDTERSAWLVLGQAVLATGRLAALVPLYLVRLALDPVATAKGLRRVVLQAAPLPGSASRAAFALETELEEIRVSLTQLDGWREVLDCQRGRIDHLSQEIKNVAAEVFGTGQVFATKKEAFLHAYPPAPRLRGPQRGRQGGGRAGPRRAASARHRPLLRVRGTGPRERRQQVTTWHLYLAALAILAVPVLIWRFTVSSHAVRSNRVRAMRWRVLFRLRPDKGFASLAELGLHWSRLAALHHGRRTRPSARWITRMTGRPEAYGVRLGRAQYGKRVFARQEDQTLILATQRTGKSGLLADRILAHPGAVVATSTRADLFEHTAPERARLGPVDVFNPGRIGNLPSTFGWDIIGGCEQPGEAYLRADALIGPRHEDMGGDMAWWMGKAATALGALMHAAALTPGADLTDVWAWCNRHGDAMAGDALANHPAASPVLAAVFSEIKREGRSPDSIHLTMGKALAWLAVPEVRAMVTAPVAGEFDVASFALGRGALYMIAPAGIGTLVAPLFRTFVDYVHREAGLAGSWAPAGKLDPPMLLALDEVPVIVPVPLDVWLADSAGKGILIAAVCHGTGQLRERWGTHGAETIWATTGTKMFLPGIQDAATLKDISELCGTIPVPQGEGTVFGPVVPPDFIRTLPTGRALIISMNQSPVVVKFRPVWKRLSHRSALRWTRPPLPVLLSAQDRLAAIPAEPRPQSPQPTWPTAPVPDRAARSLPALRFGPEDVTE